MVSSKAILAGSSLAALTLFHPGGAMAQTTAPMTTLPSVEVDAPKHTQAPRRPKVRIAVDRRRTNSQAKPQTEAPAAVEGQSDRMDEARQSVLPPGGATTHTLTRQAIEALPQGSNASLDKVLLQFPGVTQDSAASGDLHIRNEHANLQ